MFSSLYAVNQVALRLSCSVYENGNIHVFIDLVPKPRLLTQLLLRIPVLAVPVNALYNDACNIPSLSSLSIIIASCSVNPYCAYCLLSIISFSFPELANE